LRARLQALPPTTRSSLFALLDPADARELEQEWYLRDPSAKGARDEQVPPDGSWSTWLVLAGRGWGKTRTGAEWVHERVRQGARYIALVAPTAADARDVMVEGPAGILACARVGDRPLYESSKRRVTWSNGATATLFSAEEPDRLRGPQHDTAWCDEVSSWSRIDDAWSMLQFGMRLGQPRTLVTTTPRPVKVVRDLLADPSTVVTRGSTYDNAANLAGSFLAEIRRRYEGTRLGRQELYAEVLTDTPGSLWTYSTIEKIRVSSVPELRRVVVAIDPSVAADGGGDECGIVVAGVDYEGVLWVLRDGSGNLSPSDWSRRAVALADEHQADAIVAESNQGGALVEQTLRAAGARMRVRLVHAARGKRARAEPVAALYEQGRVRHLPGLQRLEDELCTWASASGDPSPNRLDALVWACFDLGGLAAPARVASETGYDF
jgi:phage terminase large subunit-like protein